MTLPLPKKLEDALEAQPRFKPDQIPSPSVQLNALLNDTGVAPPDEFSFERGILDSIMGRGASQSISIGTNAGSSKLFPSREKNADRVLSESAVNQAMNRIPPSTGLRTPRGGRRSSPRKEKTPPCLETKTDYGGGIDERNPKMDGSSSVPGSSLLPNGGGGGSGRRPGSSSAGSSRVGSSPGGVGDSGVGGSSSDDVGDLKASRELIASMAARLNRLEQSSRDLRKELVERDKQVLKLRRRNSVLERTVGDHLPDDGPSPCGDEEHAAAPSSSSSSSSSSSRENKLKHAVGECAKLAAKNRRLEETVGEMEQFLADYGLAWKGAYSRGNDDEDDEDGNGDGGDEEGGDGNGARVPPQLTAAAAAVASGVPHFDAFFAKVEELNGLVEAQGPRLVMEGNRAKYEFGPQSVSVVVFADGVAINTGKGKDKGGQGGSNRGGGAGGVSGQVSGGGGSSSQKFRPYGDASCQRFVRDVADGYFPSEFKDAFPDGVHIAATDRRTEFGGGSGGGSSAAGEQAAGGPPSFSGEGNVLGHAQQTQPPCPPLTAIASSAAVSSLAEVGGGAFLNLTPRTPRLIGLTTPRASERSSKSEAEQSKSSRRSRSAASADGGGGGGGGGGSGESGGQHRMSAAELLATLPDGKAVVDRRGNVVDFKGSLKRRLVSKEKEEAPVAASASSSSARHGGGAANTAKTLQERRVAVANAASARENVAAAAAAATAISVGSSTNDSNEEEGALKGSGGNGTAVPQAQLRSATLRVRLPERGAKALLLTLPFHATLLDLQRKVAQEAECGAEDFELRTAFLPSRTFHVAPAGASAAAAIYGDGGDDDDDGKLTLEGAGLVPSSALILRRRTNTKPETTQRRM